MQVLISVLAAVGWLTARYTRMAIKGDIALDLSLSSFKIPAHRVVRQSDG